MEDESVFEASPGFGKVPAFFFQCTPKLLRYSIAKGRISHAVSQLIARHTSDGATSKKTIQKYKNLANATMMAAEFRILLVEAEVFGKTIEQYLAEIVDGATVSEMDKRLSKHGAGLLIHFDQPTLFGIYGLALKLYRRCHEGSSLREARDTLKSLDYSLKTGLDIWDNRLISALADIARWHDFKGQMQESDAAQLMDYAEHQSRNPALSKLGLAFEGDVGVASRFGGIVSVLPDNSQQVLRLTYLENGTRIEDVQDQYGRLLLREFWKGHERLVSEVIDLSQPGKSTAVAFENDGPCSVSAIDKRGITTTVTLPDEEVGYSPLPQAVQDFYEGLPNGGSSKKLEWDWQTARRLSRGGYRVFDESRRIERKVIALNARDHYRETVSAPGATLELEWLVSSATGQDLAIEKSAQPWGQG